MPRKTTRVPDPSKRVVGLTRISTDQDNQPYSLDAQRRAVETYVEAHAWTLVDLIEEEMSGAAESRPALEKVLGMVRSGRVDVVVVTRVDRLSRTIRGLMDVVEELDRHGVELVSVTESIDTSTPGGRMFLQFLGVFAEFERRVLIERIRAGLRTKAGRGQWVGGPPPFGYRLLDRSLVIEASEAAVVRRVFQSYAAGDGANTIANALNQDGLRTTRGNSWTAQGVLGMLRRVTYCGQIKHLEEVHDGAHEAIVDADLFDAVQERLGTQGASTGQRQSRTYLLAGTLRCGLCGSPMTGALAGGNGGQYRYYRCTGAAKARAKCRGVAVRADEIENGFLERLVKAYRSKGIFEAAVASMTNALPSLVDEVEAELSATRKLIESDRQRIDRYLDAFERGRLNADQAHDRIDGLAETKRAKEQHCVELEERLAVLRSAERPLPSLEDAADIVERVLRGPMEPTKRFFVEAAVASMTIDDHRRVALTLRVPSPGTVVSETSSLVELGGIEPPSIRRRAPVIRPFPF